MSCALASYSNSSYATNLNARRSMTGYVSTIDNFFVSWKATLQPSMTSSTTKIEYMTLVEASKEGMWLKDLINNVGFTQ